MALFDNNEKQIINMNNIFIDCGTHLGEGFKKHVEEYKIDENWLCYSFEANPNTFRLMQDQKNKKNIPSKYNYLNWKNCYFYNKAVWIKDDIINFYCSSVNKTEELKNDNNYKEFLNFCDDLTNNGELIINHQSQKQPIDGSSTIFSERSKNFLINNGNSLQKNLVWNTLEKVESIDFSQWLKNNIKEEDYVVCKIDIEGAEYEVLKKCIKDNSLKLINHLNIEWHHFNEEESYKNFELITQELNKLNITYTNWQ